MDRYDRATEYNNIGGPPFTAEHANLSFSGFENFIALTDPALYEAAGSFSAQSYNPLHPTPNIGPLSGYSTSAAQQNHSVASLISSQDTQSPYNEKLHRSRRTPRIPISPHLRSANSLGFSPLYPADVSLAVPPALISPPNGYFPAPPDVSYAESAASSTYSVPEEEEFPQLAEDEKRKRNLAASARFRQKKKQREMMLEKATKDLNDRADELESRITELEQENELLKAMLTEKVDTMTKADRLRFDKVAEELEV